jgi:phosphate transport system protein
MLRHLLSIFRASNPLTAMGNDFSQMLKITYETTMKAGDVFSGVGLKPEERTWIYEQDIQVNKLERKIRKQVIAHLSIVGRASDLPYCLLLMSLVKDVERLGDYAKNVSEIADLYNGSLPEDELFAELQEIRQGVEVAFAATAGVFERSDIERALELTRQGQDLARRCEMLIERLAHSDHDARTVTALVLATRYYKRIGGHVLNILSAVTMPLHKVDYYDEDAVLVDDDED